MQKFEKMDKRTWPWKKKFADKTSASTDAEPVSPFQSSEEMDDQAMPGLISDQVRVSNVVLSQDQADEKIRHLNQRLLAADHLVKQHVKVAEEAVSGWEKSKAECASLKNQLGAIVEQKEASEDRVSHLDGALKESTWQLRQIREEQEQRIHDATVKRTREWESSRSELQQQLADADHQLVESGFQNSLLQKSIQDQAAVIANLGRARSQAEAEVEMLQVRVETFEKENASLKYELMIVNKELKIRNQEQEINKKSLDAASWQKAESARRIKKLEADCQRLRNLLGKKLPGPGALVQMKLEVEGLDRERGYFHNNWRPCGTVVSSPKAADSIASSESCFSERLLTMEEETKMLKEALAKRNSELQSARLACAQTADKLSNLECQVGQVQNSPKKSMLGYGYYGSETHVSRGSCKDSSQASASEDGNDDDHSVADSYASPWITELARFRKDSATFSQLSKGQHSHTSSGQLDSTDDFIEVERLLSLPSQQQGLDVSTEKESLSAKVSKEVLDAKEAKLKAANVLCAELNSKLALAEEQATAMVSKNAANELSLFSLQQKLNRFLEAHDGVDTEKALEDVRSAVLALHCSSVDGLQAQVIKLSKGSTPSIASDTSPYLTFPLQESSPCKCDKGNSTIRPELTSAISKVGRLVEEFALESNKAQQLKAFCFEECPSDSGCGHSSMPASSTQRPSELDTILTNLISTTNQLLQGKGDLVQLMRELLSVLNHVINVGLPTSCLSLNGRERHKQDAIRGAEQEVFSDAGSPVSTTSNFDGSEHKAVKVSSSDDRVLNSRKPRADEELRKVRAEKAALESHMKAEFSRMDKIEEMLALLQHEKAELSSMLEDKKEKLEVVENRLLDAEQLVASLRVRLASTEMSRNVADERLSSTTLENAKLVSQLQERQSELSEMHRMLSSLEKSVDREHAKNEELQAKVELLQEQLLRANSNGSDAGVGPSAEKFMKGEEIADASEKLAECQRTILVLGKQIQTIASGRGSLTVSFNSPANDNQEDGSPRAEFIKSADVKSTLQKLNQNIRSNPGDFGSSDETDEELVLAANGIAHAEDKGKSDWSNNKVATHEDYIQAVSQMPTSPEAESNTQLVPYTSKTAAKKSSLALADAINLTKSLSSPKRVNSFSRFFSRNKKSLS